MNMTISKAQRLIAGVLCELENDTGSVVKHIEVIDVETTRFSDSERRLERRVGIELERLPGTNWAK